MDETRFNQLLSLCQSIIALFQRERELIDLQAWGELPALFDANRLAHQDIESLIAHENVSLGGPGIRPLQQQAIGSLHQAIQTLANSNMALVEEHMMRLQAKSSALHRNAHAALAYRHSRSV